MPEPEGSAAVEGADSLHAVLEALPVGILMVNAGGAITLVNASAERILGYDRAELIGHPVDTLLPEPFRARHASHRRDFLTHPGPRQMGAGRDLFARRKDGREIPVEIGLSPITTPAGAFVVASIVDISERKAHEELQRIERQKEELAALVVHDLKSPAAGIMMMAQAQLRRAGLSDADRTLWNLVFASAQVINRMVLNLLDIASSADGVFAITPATVDVSTVVTAADQLMTPVAESLGQRIEVRLAPGIPPLQADPELLRRVLQNLLDNALRLSPRGSTVVMAAEASDRAVTFRVSDRGPGVPPELKERIFDKYVRIARQPRPGQGPSFGKGLGLAFSRIAVEAHGGRIFVEDNVPSGSTFAVEIPRR